jgi:hypothetical protein
MHVLAFKHLSEGISLMCKHEFDIFCYVLPAATLREKQAVWNWVLRLNTIWVHEVHLVAAYLQRMFVFCPRELLSSLLHLEKSWKGQ